MMGFDPVDLNKRWLDQGNGCRVRYSAQIHTSVVMGFNNIIGNARIAEDVIIGHNCVIDGDVEIGRGSVLKSGVELRSGTIIGENCYIDSGVICTGMAVIGDNVTLRNNVVVARGCNIGERAFICPQVMFNNLDHHGESIGGAHVGAGCFIGTQSVIGAGIQISPGVVVGSCSMVTKDLDSPGTFVGVPAKRMK